jgi:hypothetical protein
MLKLRSAYENIESESFKTKKYSGTVIKCMFSSSEMSVDPFFHSSQLLSNNFVFGFFLQKIATNIDQAFKGPFFHT